MFLWKSERPPARDQAVLVTTLLHHTNKLPVKLRPDLSCVSGCVWVCVCACVCACVCVCVFVCICVWLRGRGAQEEAHPPKQLLQMFPLDMLKGEEWAEARSRLSLALTADWD